MLGQALKIDANVTPVGDLYEHLVVVIHSNLTSRLSKAGICSELVKLWGVFRLVMKYNGFKLTNIQARKLSNYIAIIERTELLCISEMTEEAQKNKNEKSPKFLRVR